MHLKNDAAAKGSRSKTAPLVLSGKSLLALRHMSLGPPLSLNCCTRSFALLDDLDRELRALAGTIVRLNRDGCSTHLVRLDDNGH